MPSNSKAVVNITFSFGFWRSQFASDTAKDISEDFPFRHSRLRQKVSQTFADIGQQILLPEGRKEGNILFNDTLNTFYLRLYGVGHMVKDHSDSERGNLLPLHGLLFPINSKGSFICTIPQTG